MTDATRTPRIRFWLWLIALVGVIVPRRLRADWRQEWEAERRYREALLAEWERLDWKNQTRLALAQHERLLGCALVTTLDPSAPR